MQELYTENEQMT